MMVDTVIYGFNVDEFLMSDLTPIHAFVGLSREKWAEILSLIK